MGLVYSRGRHFLLSECRRVAAAALAIEGIARLRPIEGRGRRTSAAMEPAGFSHGDQRGNPRANRAGRARAVGASSIRVGDDEEKHAAQSGPIPGRTFRTMRLRSRWNRGEWGPRSALAGTGEGERMLAPAGTQTGAAAITEL
jgi:hypothetical protein